MQAPKLTGQSFRTVLQHLLFLVECRSMPVAALWQLRCYTWQLTGEGLFTSAPALWLSPLPNSKEKMLLQAGSLENQRHLLPEAPSWVLSMGRRLGAKVEGGGGETSIGSHVSTELFCCFLSCTITDCSGGSQTERRIFRQAQAQEKCAKPGAGKERAPSTTPETVFIGKCVANYN